MHRNEVFPREELCSSLWVQCSPPQDAGSLSIHPYMSISWAFSSIQMPLILYMLCFSLSQNAFFLHGKFDHPGCSWKDWERGLRTENELYFWTCDGEGDLQQTAMWKSATRKISACVVQCWLFQVGVKLAKHLSAIVFVGRSFYC